MKRNLQIGCIAIASYLLVLPILFIIHNFTHHHSTEHNCFETKSSENAINGFDDCSICDLFQNQQLFHQQTPQLFLVEQIVEACIIEALIHHHFRLIDISTRGPPVS